jgi:short-subunit dehydrogenase
MNSSYPANATSILVRMRLPLDLHLLQFRPINLITPHLDNRTPLGPQILPGQGYYAAYSAIGSFFQRPLEDHLLELDTNCRTPLALVHAFGQRMLRRGRGGILLMSSLSAQQGSSYIANYSATKAYNWILAEGLWDELRRQGVNVLVVCAEAISTPNYSASAPSQTSRLSGAATTPKTVVASALAGLGKGPEVVPGLGFRLSAFVMQHLLPRKLAVRIMDNILRNMYAA